MDSKNGLSFFLFLLVPYISVSQNTVCLDWQHPVGNSCYYIYHKLLPWADSLETCRLHYGQLVHIYDASIQGEVVSMLAFEAVRQSPATSEPSDQPFDPLSWPRSQQKYWIGAKYTDGNIRWVSQPGQNDTYDMQYPMTNYSQMESGIWPASFTCLVIDLADHRWSAQPCDGLVSGFICQYETGEPMMLNCSARGYSRPNITWYKDGSVVRNSTGGNRISESFYNRVVTTSLYLSSPSSGSFVCNASAAGLPSLRVTQLPMKYPEWNAPNLKEFISSVNSSIEVNGDLQSGEDEKDDRRLVMFKTLQFLTERALGSPVGVNTLVQEDDIDVHISSISSLRQLRNLSQDGDTTNPHIWLTSDSQFMASVSQNWSDPQAGTVPMEMTVLSVKFPRVAEEMVSDGVYSAVVSDILCYTVFVDGQAVSAPVHYKLPTQVKKARQVMNSTHTRELQCGFMEQQQLLSNDWGWSTEGCSLVSLHQETALCSCNHTTNFALLMQIVPIEISETHAKALSVVTYAGCGISICSSLLALTVFIVLRLYTQDRTFIHINLVLSLLLLQVVFLAGVSMTQIKDVCTAVSVSLHYLSLAVFCWMLVEGIHLYRQVVQVFDSARHKKTYVAIGYVLPACIVGVAATVRSGGYSDPDRTSCWLSMDHDFHWAFIGPAIIIIMVNIVITGQVLRIVVSAAHVTKQQSAAQVAGKGLLVLAPITGLTWAFALMAVSRETLVFQYLFAIFNSLQGLFVFLIHCVFNSEVRNTWDLWVSKRAARRHALNLDSSKSGKDRKVSGSSQDTTDKTRLHVIDLPRGPDETSKMPKQIAPVACKDVDWTQSSKGVDRIESCKGMDRNGPRNSASHKDTDVSLHSPSIAWSM